MNYKFSAPIVSFDLNIIVASRLYKSTYMYIVNQAVNTPIDFCAVQLGFILWEWYQRANYNDLKLKAAPQDHFTFLLEEKFYFLEWLNQSKKGIWHFSYPVVFTFYEEVLLTFF